MTKYLPGVNRRLALEFFYLDIQYRSLIFWETPNAKRVPGPRFTDVPRKCPELDEEPEEELEEGIEPENPRRSPRRAAEDQEVESALLDVDMEKSA